MAGDGDSGVTLVESLDELVCEIVGDLYLSRFGAQRDVQELGYSEALRLALVVVSNPPAELRPLDPEPESTAGIRLGFARAVLARLEIRKRCCGVLGCDDLLARLAGALAAEVSAARVRISTSAGRS